MKISNSAVKKIEKWLTDTVKDGSWRRHNDLHVDEISTEYKKPTIWIESGIECLKTAIDIRNRLNVPFLVQLYADLISDIRPIGINFNSFREFNKQLSNTPPSLYIYYVDEKQKKLYENKDQIIIPDVKINGVEIFYFETLFEDPEYYRSVTFVSFPK